MAACGGDSRAPTDPGQPGSPQIASLTVTPSSTTQPVGVTVQATAILKDQAGQVLPPSTATVIWSSRDSAVATVSPSGAITTETPGTVWVIAAVDSLSDSTKVVVAAPPPPPTGNAYNLVYSTYWGGTLQDQIRDVATDAAGNVYIAGGAESPNIVTTPGAYDETPNGNYDVFVAKFSPTGQLLWSTVIGGPNYDRAYGIELDPAGNIYIAGRAGAGFPVTPGAFQTTFAGGDPNALYGEQDGFVCKLNAGGTAVIYCSYFGTSDNQIIRDVAVDAAGHAFLASSRVSGSFPASWFANAFQPQPSAQTDGVVAEVSADGSQILWATYLGGSGDETGQASIRVAPDGAPVALYVTSSPDMPTPGGFDHSLSGPTDVYVAKLTTDGSALTFGTYLGGSSDEGSETHELAVDSSGAIYVASTTHSADFPTTTGAFQRVLHGPSDAFVAKIAANGSQLLAATFVGGDSTELAEGVAADAAGNVYVSGSTPSTDFPVTADAFQGSPGGGADAFAFVLSADFSHLRYATLLGGSGDSHGRTCAVTADGGFAVGGMLNDGNYPVLNAFQSAWGGSGDGLLARFRPGP